MTAKKSISKSKKTAESKPSKNVSKKGKVSEFETEKKETNNSETNISVFTKTTNPKVLIQSENLNTPNSYQNQNICKHSIMKFICLITIGIIILMTFFLTLKTYNTVNELSTLLSN